MSSFRQKKAYLLHVLSTPTWQKELRSSYDNLSSAKMTTNALIGLLAREDVCWQATWGLGQAIAYIEKHNKDDARILIRRFMWNLNEESGNIGWGMPEAIGAALAQIPDFAKEYARILLSYCRDTGHDDNFIDHAPLRKGAYWAIAYLAAFYPHLLLNAPEVLIKGLHDELLESQGLCCWGLSRFYTALPAQEQAKKEKQLLLTQYASHLNELTKNTAPLVFLHDEDIQATTISALARELVATLHEQKELRA